MSHWTALYVEQREESPYPGKIDRWFSTADWDTGHPGHLLQALSSSISDHCPLLMSTNVSFHRKSRFHFQSYWPSLPGFHDVVAGSWNSLPPKANPFVDLFLRLKATAKALTRWNQAKVGNIKEQMLLANELILCFDQAMDSRPLSSGETWLRKQLKKKVLGLASLQRTIARQKLRISWPKAGEASEAFFKIFASQRRRKNHIFRLKSGAAEATSRAGMCEMAGDYYAGLLGRPVLRQHTLRLAALELPAVDTATLETPLSETLIWNTVKDM
nr:uncharacterized protein LOC120975902 [Aegilops tauschii subsp. strangulata]